MEVKNDSVLSCAAEGAVAVRGGAGVKERRIFPIVASDLIDDRCADRALERWGHWLGRCKRPFGQSNWARLNWAGL